MIKRIKELIVGILNPGENRNLFRLRGILFTGLSTFGSKAVNLLVTFISVPLTYNYLGDERFGMMMTILSIIAMINFADMGLGLGLMNRLAEFENSEDKNALRKAISSTFFFLILIATLFFGIFVLVSQFIAWSQIFNVTSDLAIQESRTAVFIFVSCFVCSLPFSIIQKVQGGFQEGYYNSFWEAGGNIMGLLLLLLFVYQRLGVPYFILAVYGSRVLFLILNFLYQFLFVRRHLFPTFNYFDKNIVKIILKDGVFFFLLQFMTMLVNASDSVIVAHYLGAEIVAIYAIGFRLFSIFMMPAQAFIAPTWPAYNDAFARDDMKWLKKTTLRILKIVFLTSLVFSAIFFLLSNLIISIWINESVVLTTSLLIGFSVYIFYFNINGFLSNILSTSKYLNYLILVYPITAIVVIIMKIGFINYFESIESVLWATILGCGICYFIPGFIKLRKEGLIG